MFEGVHDEDGEAQSEDVGQEAGVEVGSAVLLEATGRRTNRQLTAAVGGQEEKPSATEGRTTLPDVEAQQQGNENTRDDDVTQTQHGKVTGCQAFLQQVLREDH